MGIGEDFITNTRYTGPVETDQTRGLNQPPMEDDFSGTIIPLPDPDAGTIESLDISVAIESRESIRKYLDTPLTIEELSYLLWCTQGVKWILEDCSFRTVPSAGARHAIDTYLLINKINTIKPGLYRFLAFEHSLGMISEDKGITDLVFRAGMSQQCIQESALCFIWVADSYRMTWRYGERGFRDIFLEAGHICQNLYLSAQAVGCGVCAIGAFMDNDLNHLLNIDGKKKFALYMASVGKVPGCDER
ncbi:SagB/ThcOx family dehydrogenase [Methanospirillum stamsii]|uniref:Nitroreductase n=1 Tax=Methanospirillum stamsii TaxID=1277351 RepID=A0A2V2NK90_9EURY|nr:SagB/ThcOx family dehydrogenase [Methanospirillum stamsii]PWR76031.1 nitroreductase [Methanospirillum stamsii]